ncbi:MAG TPA: hypothetical protein PLI09_29035, partial [Candidatus Hydrogenedentes bacterium]|nr:hypothetical protein [Candidatus Hydrogenedentota bacterium]
EWTLLTHVEGVGQTSPEAGKLHGYTNDSTATISAIPGAGWGFSNWTGDLSGEANPSEIQMNANHEVTAVFKPLYALNFSARDIDNLAILYGSPLLVPSGNPTGYFLEGQAVQVIPAVFSDWEFVSWEGDLSGNAQPGLLTMTSQKTVVAVYSRILADVNMDASKVVPPTTSIAVGNAKFRNNVSSVLLAVTHNVANPVSIEIWAGAPSQAGTIKYLELNSAVSPVIQTLDALDFALISDGAHYIVVNSTDFPNGEIRGDIPLYNPDSLEGQYIAEGQNEGEGEGDNCYVIEGNTMYTPQCLPFVHTADHNQDWTINLSELLRVVQFVNSNGLHCDSSTEDGYAPGFSGDHTCTPHDADYNPQDWVVTISELMRLIQFFNMGGYHIGIFEDETTEQDLVGGNRYGIKPYAVPVPDETDPKILNITMHFPELRSGFPINRVRLVESIPTDWEYLGVLGASVAPTQILEDCPEPAKVIFEWDLGSSAQPGYIAYSMHMPLYYTADFNNLDVHVEYRHESGCTIVPGKVENEIVFPDPVLRAAVLEAIGKTAPPIFRSDLVGTGFVSLELPVPDEGADKITNLEGLQYCADLLLISLDGHLISDLTPMETLTQLRTLSLDSNAIESIESLEGLIHLQSLELADNDISDISFLSSMNLHSLDISGNSVSDISALQTMSYLTTFWANNNQIANLGPLGDLAQLHELHLEDNAIINLASFAYYNLDFDCSTPGDCDSIYLDENPLSSFSICIVIPYMESRGVDVYFESEVCRWLLELYTFGPGTVDIVTPSNPPEDNLFLDGTVVGLEASPNTGADFDGWHGDATGTNILTSIQMDSDKVIYALFSSYGSYYPSTSGASTVDVQFLIGLFEDTVYQGEITALSLWVTLPANWTMNSVTPTFGHTRPDFYSVDGQQVRFVWYNLPAGVNNPYFECVLNVPEGQSGTKDLSYYATYRTYGDECITAVHHKHLYGDASSSETASAFIFLLLQNEQNSTTPIDEDHFDCDDSCYGAIRFHSADYNPSDWQINLSELLRVIQFFNSGGYHTDSAGEDGFVPGWTESDEGCPHDADQNTDGMIGLSELLRIIQFFNSGGYHVQSDIPTEDGFEPGYEDPGLELNRSVLFDGHTNILGVTLSFNTAPLQAVSALAFEEQLPDNWTYTGEVTAPQSLTPSVTFSANGSPTFAWNDPLPLIEMGSFTYFLQLPPPYILAEQNPVITGTLTYQYVGNCSYTTPVATTQLFQPTLTLNGPGIVEVACLDAYIEFGATATDIIDGDISDRVIIEPGTPSSGTHTLTYTVTNRLGFSAVPVTRSVTIGDECEEPDPGEEYYILSVFAPDPEDYSVGGPGYRGPVPDHPDEYYFEQGGVAYLKAHLVSCPGLFQEWDVSTFDQPSTDNPIEIDMNQDVYAYMQMRRLLKITFSIIGDGAIEYTPAGLDEDGSIGRVETYNSPH